MRLFDALLVSRMELSEDLDALDEQLLSDLSQLSVAEGQEVFKSHG